jgi:hypothetical protein
VLTARSTIEKAYSAIGSIVAPKYDWPSQNGGGNREIESAISFFAVAIPR